MDFQFVDPPQEEVANKMFDPINLGFLAMSYFIYVGSLLLITLTYVIVKMCLQMRQSYHEMMMLLHGTMQDVADLRDATDEHDDHDACATDELEDDARATGKREDDARATGQLEDDARAIIKFEDDVRAIIEFEDDARAIIEFEDAAGAIIEFEDDDDSLSTCDSSSVFEFDDDDLAAYECDCCITYHDAPVEFTDVIIREWFGPDSDENGNDEYFHDQIANDEAGVPETGGDPPGKVGGEGEDDDAGEAKAQ